MPESPRRRRKDDGPPKQDDDGQPASRGAVRLIAYEIGKTLGDELKPRDKRLHDLEEAVRGLVKIMAAGR